MNDNKAKKLVEKLLNESGIVDVGNDPDYWIEPEEVINSLKVSLIQSVEELVGEISSDEEAIVEELVASDAFKLFVKRLASMHSMP